MKHIDFRHFSSKLTHKHNIGLKWFRSMNNKNGEFFYQHVPNIDEKVSLFSAEAGLYKPKDSDYILSIKETTGKKRTHTHEHIPLLKLDDGSSIYLYHHELNEELNAVERAMKRNIEEEVPIGIAIEVESPDSRLRYDYKIGFVYGWYKNYYVIHCVNDDLNIEDDLSDKKLSSIFDRVKKK
ncbi:hypothetical protein [Nosocomiicoccus ampullae]|uniref:Uncharacterized protein n=1 Tax=Nosocomiicoccus ampullae TaxID=489910 RepID=A0A9Q2CYN0_9STAP|nr:hypothetical protein [Nosocomiicoccus ampullae]MBB5175510.1 hypothetical protein [Nosocomiicoccus ampullae]QYA46917.1 hypothetical protein KPF49_00215 [Nosocomiicoccus ampullae]